VKQKIFTVILSIAFISCSTSYEVVNPFKNLGYSGDRLFPVKTNLSEYTFRIWISNSTSIDRVISISKDSADDYKGKLIEFGKTFNGKTYIEYYKCSDIEPKDGFAMFRQLLDSLNLLTTRNKTGIDIVHHKPFSTYVVEVKEKGAFNTFRFDTYYPNKTEDADVYTKIEQLIFEQFDLKKMFKFKSNGS
jgi:hypothetical protein